MRIMLVTMDYPPPVGGIQIVTKNLEEDLIAAGHDVCLLNFDGRNTSNFKKLNLKDFFSTKATQNNYYGLKNILNPKNLLLPSGFRDFVYDNLIFRETNRARKSFRPDITHILKPCLYTAVFECKEPFIVSCHGSDVEDVFPVRYSLENAAAIHCVSNYLKVFVDQILKNKKINKTTVIHNSVDIDMYDNQTGPRENIIITCCRLVKRKNIDSVLRAISILPIKFQQNYRFVIIGDGPEKKALINLTNSLNLRNVEFLGELRGKNKIDWLCRAKLFVLCPDPFIIDSESGIEGFGISYIEAQAAGLPVIGANQGGIPDAVGDAGILVNDPKCPEEIADSIKLILDKGNLYDQYKNNGLTRVREFERKQIFSQFEQLYLKVLDHA